MEDDNFVQSALLDAVPIGGDGVHHGGPGHRGVDAAEIDGEMVVDEDPHVVIAGEGEPFEKYRYHNAK